MNIKISYQVNTLGQKFEEFFEFKRVTGRSPLHSSVQVLKRLNKSIFLKKIKYEIYIMKILEFLQRVLFHDLGGI